jgi:predicted dehydrogenase
VTVRVALAGCGGWGQNILRVLTQSPRAEVVAVADPAAPRRELAARVAPRARVVPSFAEALACAPDAVLIATPPHSHAALALSALAAGADVFVEKPLCTSAADADRLAARAAALGRVGMVGHLLRYHATVIRLIEIAASGALGPLRRFEASRLSVNGDRSASALWSLGPHDLSVLHALDRSPLTRVSARAGASGDPVRLEATLASGLELAISLSRTAPAKERRTRVVGADAAVTFDDLRGPDRLWLGDRELQVPLTEPLAVEVEHFLRCVEERARPLTSFEDGRLVVHALAAAEEALTAPGEAQEASIS